MQDVYESILQTTELIDGGVPLFPGRVLQPGFEGEDVTTVQEELAYLSQVYTEIPPVEVTGVYDAQTEAAVRAFQELFGLEVDGVVGVTTWDTIASAYSNIRFGNTKRVGQYPGYPLAEEATT